MCNFLQLKKKLYWTVFHTSWKLVSYKQTSGNKLKKKKKQLMNIPILILSLTQNTNWEVLMNGIPIGDIRFDPLKLGHYSLTWLHKHSTEHLSQPQAVQHLPRLRMHIRFTRQMTSLIQFTIPENKITHKKVRNWNTNPCIRMIIKVLDELHSGTFLFTLRFILIRSTSYTRVKTHY